MKLSPDTQFLFQRTWINEFMDSLPTSLNDEIGEK